MNHTNCLVSALLLALSLALAGCGAEPSLQDADAGSPADSGQPPDAGTSAIDAGGGDAGGEPDAGTCTPPTGGEIGTWGYPLDGWNWEKQGVLFEDSQASTNDGYFSPALVEARGRLHLYFAKKEGIEQRLLHSESADGVAWSAPQLVTGLGEGTVVTSPTVHFDGSKFRMWFGSGSIDYAESADGQSWTVVETGVFGASGEQGTFDFLSVLYPSVVRTEDGWALYYSGFSGSTYAIGRALSTDGIAWTRPTEPVLTKGSSTAFDNAAVAQPRVVPTSDGYLMWYGGYDTRLTNPGPWRVGLAESADGLAWTRRGISVDLPASGADAWSTRDPAVLRYGDGWLLVYVGMGSDSRYRLLWATSDVCVR